MCKIGFTNLEKRKLVFLLDAYLLQHLLEPVLFHYSRINFRVMLPGLFDVFQVAVRDRDRAEHAAGPFQARFGVHGRKLDAVLFDVSHDIALQP
jgi:hypothetical protein